MFIHGKTGRIYYSVRDKIDYYNGVLSGKIKASNELKEKAKERLKELKNIYKQSYNEPKVIVADDKKFGNQINKPRMCVAIREDNKNRIFVAPIQKNVSNYIVFDNDINRQISKTSDGRNKWINRDDVYEVKYFSPELKLTTRDKEKIKRLYK